MKRISVFILFALSWQCAVAQTPYGRMDFSLQNAQGQAISGATITVYNQSACGSPATTLAALYATSTGTTKANPVTTDGLGHAFAYAPQACYTYVYYSPFTGTQTYPDQYVYSVGSGQTLPEATAKGQYPSAIGPGFTYSAVNPGVINPRTMFGAVPDGSTDNSTAIANAFTAAASLAPGNPTVHFDCNGATSCKYNYGGSGTSPINLSVPMSVTCDQGVQLNYTGTAHAVDIPIAPAPYRWPYTISGCTFTGGATMTQGIVIDNNESVNITDNVFLNFGNQTGATIYVGAGQTCFDCGVYRNRWLDTDGFARNMVDMHAAGDTTLHFGQNLTECSSGSNTPCSVATVGYGVWTGPNAVIIDNEIKFHAPEIIVGQAAVSKTAATIAHNLLESNTGQAAPMIEFGNPGEVGNLHLGGWTIEDNTFAGSGRLTNGTSIIGPATASSGLYYIDGNSFINNWFSAAQVGVGGFYIDTNVSGPNYISGNHNESLQLIDYAFTGAGIPATFTNLDSNQQWGIYNTFGSGTGNANALLAFGSTGGGGMLRATWQNIEKTLICSDTSGSGSAQSCDNTIDRFTAQAVGDFIIYQTTTTNTGALTLVFNGKPAAAVKKRQGTTDLAAGDLLAGHPVILIWNGTVWQLNDPVVP